MTNATALTSAAIVIAFALLGSHGALAQTATGGSALALAALASESSPLLSAPDKSAMSRMLEGNLGSLPARKITIQADSIVCKASNVDISSHSCDLTFGKKTLTLKGRKAHELFATIAENGVPADGAAGTIYEGLSHLVCEIDPREIQQKAGGGASCKFDPGPP